MSAENWNADNLIKETVLNLDRRQREVLTRRFGLSGPKITLAAIGNKYKITRERVRQIENQAVKKIQPIIKERAAEVIAKAKTYLASFGGLRRDDFLNKDIKNADKTRFILFVANDPYFFKANDEFHSFWYLNDEAKDEAFRLIKSTESALKKKGGSFDNQTAAPDEKSLNYLSVSKRVGFNIFGYLGLTEWPEISPKTVRDKIYLVMKKEKRPLHFTELTSLINRFKFDKKNAHLQTVHNELIKDDRFILVGRGLYGLREFGYEPGTTEEIIARLLKKERVLTANQIVDLVLKRKFVKHNTVLLNLQNKSLFRRLNDGRYSLA